VAGLFNNNAKGLYLVQLLLPLYSNAGNKFPQEFYAHVRDELVDRFGGITAYTRAPVRGLWQEIEGQTVRDDLIIYEVMVERLDGKWWREYRATLEKRFEQESLVVRAHRIRIL
jgi:hypothetical protein